MSERYVIEALRQEAHVIQPDDSHDRIIDLIGDASLVLLGEATHGTREFYRVRAEISKRLITEKGFDALAVEADWPDALRVSRYVQGMVKPHSRLLPESSAVVEQNAYEALQGFERFPQWMWRNTGIVELVGWLRRHNMQLADNRDWIGFFGLDLYSLRSSMDPGPSRSGSRQAGTRTLRLFRPLRRRPATLGLCGRLRHAQGLRG